MEYSEKFNFKLPSAQSTTDVATIDDISDNFRIIDERVPSAEYVNKMNEAQEKRTKTNSANAIKKTVSRNGSIEIVDVSCVEHPIKVRLLGRNILPWPQPRASTSVWTVNEDGSFTCNKNTSTGSLITIATFSGANALPVGQYQLSCIDAPNTSNSARVIVTNKDGTTEDTLHAYGDYKPVFTVDENTESVVIRLHCAVNEPTTFSPVLSKATDDVINYIQPTKWEDVTVYCAETNDVENPQTAVPDENGFVTSFQSVFPSMRVWCVNANQSVSSLPFVYCTYNQDTEKAIKEEMDKLKCVRLPFSLLENETNKTLTGILDGTVTETSGTAVATVNIVNSGGSEQVVADLTALSSCVVTIVRYENYIYPVLLRPGNTAIPGSLGAVSGTVNVMYRG